MKIKLFINILIFARRNVATKKTILKESDIKDIVEKVINELDWRTYASAYDKETNSARSNRFKDAATNAFNRQNGYGMTNIPYGEENTIEGVWSEYQSFLLEEQKSKS